MKRAWMISATMAMMACGPASEGGADAGPPVDAGKPLNPMASLPDLPPAAWTEISPGGDTVCSRGQDWSFFFRPGTVNKLVIELPIFEDDLASPEDSLEKKPGSATSA